MISSVNNKIIKEYSKLKDRKFRKTSKYFLVETYHLVEEAYKAGRLKEVFVLSEGVYSIDVNITVVSLDVMKKLSSTNTPPNIIGVVEKKTSNEIIGNKILLIDRVQDPGNLGTIIRSSCAFNVDTIVISPDSVDLYNPKVIRSAEGMMFQINIVTRDLVKVINNLKEKDFIIYGTDVSDGINPRRLDNEAKNKFAIVMGNEGNGLSYEVYDACDKFLYIPMNEKTESLNVGVAASIILYEMSCLDE